MKMAFAVQQYGQEWRQVVEISDEIIESSEIEGFIIMKAHEIVDQVLRVHEESF